MAIFAVSAFALPSVESPLDVAAPEDSRVASTRLVNVAAIDDAKGAFAAVGPWGKILTSADGGRSWRQRAAPVSSDLVAVTFPTPQQGWAVGHDGVVLHSADGGKRWTRQLDGRQYGDIMVHYYEGLDASRDPAIARALEDARRFKEDGADKPFLDVWFENERSGWVVGAFNLILKTDDGGQHWQPWIDRTDNENAYTLFAIRGVGDDVYIVGELGLVLKLDRARGRFAKLAVPYPGSFFGVVGKPGAVVVFGLRGNAFASHDAGRSWARLDTGISGGITGGAFLGDGRLALIDGDGRIAIGNGEGRDFHVVPPAIEMGLNGIVPTDGNRIILVGERGVQVEALPDVNRKNATK